MANITYILDLSKVESFATIKLNGQELATLWRLPYRTDITGAIKNGTNLLEAEVVNTWWNRVVGDARSGTAPYTWAATTVSQKRASYGRIVRPR